MTNARPAKPPMATVIFADDMSPLRMSLENTEPTIIKNGTRVTPFRMSEIAFSRLKYGFLVPMKRLSGETAEAATPTEMVVMSTMLPSNCIRSNAVPWQTALMRFRVAHPTRHGWAPDAQGRRLYP